jgi:hypothetical protein
MAATKPAWLTNPNITSESLPSDTDITAAGTYIIEQINNLLATVTTNLNNTSQNAINEVKKENNNLLALLNAAKDELEKLSRSSLIDGKITKGK